MEVDGHDVGAFIGACWEARAAAAGEVPTAIVARTHKGRGLSFTEGDYLWHARVPDAEELERARVELGLDEEGMPR